MLHIRHAWKQHKTDHVSCLTTSNTSAFCTSSEAHIMEPDFPCLKAAFQTGSGSVILTPYCQPLHLPVKPLVVSFWNIFSCLCSIVNLTVSISHCTNADLHKGQTLLLILNDLWLLCCCKSLPLSTKWRFCCVFIISNENNLCLGCHAHTVSTLWRNRDLIMRLWGTINMCLYKPQRRFSVQRLMCFYCLAPFFISMSFSFGDLLL